MQTTPGTTEDAAAPTTQDATLPHPSLASRMKSYEAQYNFTLPPDKPIIFRLDGHGFSRFTSHFARPFDERIHGAMAATSSDLLDFFLQATVAYTQSDEITLVFPHGVHTFSARIQKLASLSASYCSVRFNKHLDDALRDIPDPPLTGNTHGIHGTAHFDARIFAVPDLHEALNCLIWRCRNDAVRNAVSRFASSLFTPSQMHGKKTHELIDMMLTDKGITFRDAVPKWALEGCLVKREQYEHNGLNTKTGQIETTSRSRPSVQDRGVRTFDDAGLRLVTHKYW
ncbi:hypothetical protein ACJQWK_03615 [Exserohilum turcicum]